MLKIDREKISPAQSQLRCFVLPRFHPRPIHPLFFVVCVDFALSFHSLSLPVFSVVLLSLASPFAAAAVLALVLVLPTSDTCLQQLANTTRSKHVYIAVAVVASCLSPGSTFTRRCHTSLPLRSLSPCAPSFGSAAPAKGSPTTMLSVEIL